MSDTKKSLKFYSTISRSGRPARRNTSLPSAPRPGLTPHQPPHVVQGCHRVFKNQLSVECFLFLLLQVFPFLCLQVHLFSSLFSGASGVSASSACVFPPATPATSPALSADKPRCPRVGGFSPAPHHLHWGKAIRKHAGVGGGD